MGATMHEGRMEAVQLSIDVASVAANTTAAQTFTISGLRTTDIVLSVSKPSLSAGLGICGARVSAADTVSITFNNNTVGAIDPAAEVYTFVIFRPDGTPAGSFSPR
jgi:hypothetical protein